MKISNLTIQIAVVWLLSLVGAIILKDGMVFFAPVFATLIIVIGEIIKELDELNRKLNGE